MSDWQSVRFSRSSSLWNYFKHIPVHRTLGIQQQHTKQTKRKKR
jgi:hypothetical protein